MKKTSRVLLIILPAVFALSSCGSFAAKEDPSGYEAEADEETYDSDEMSVDSREDAVFYVMRVNDDYLEIPGECNYVYVEGGGIYPELENGQIAKVTADIKIYEGGVAGYTGNYFITDLKDQTVMSYEEVTDDLSIPEAAAEEEMSYGNKLLQYRQNDDLYFIVQIGQNVDVYLNGESVMEYEWSDPDNILEPFFEEITV